MVFSILFLLCFANKKQVAKASLFIQLSYFTIVIIRDIVYS